MSEDPDRKEQAAEAAAIRRRWITLGEGLAVVAVIISALTLWNSYAQRTATEAERAASELAADTRAATLTLKASAARDGKLLTLSPIRAEQVIQSQSIAFPSPLGVAPIGTAGEARIEARWFGEALKKARRAAGLSDRPKGDARLPVAITTRYLVDGTARSEVALYDIGYALDGQMFGGSTVRLRGLSLIAHSDEEQAPARLDALWKARAAKAPARK